MAKQNELDVLVVGAGFAGLMLLHHIRELGLSVKVIDAAGDLGGTWYWNRYPGAMSDTEAYIYRYSWDKEDLLNYPWKAHYVKQPDVLEYLEHVAHKYQLRKDIQFNTEFTGATFDEANNVWKVECSTGDTFTARFVISALGLLSKTNYPDIKGIDRFKGEMYHTGQFPKDYDFRTQRVGVIGCGSTGVQVITALGGKVKQLTCFQRSPQYSVPSGDGPVDPSGEYRKSINERYDKIWQQVWNSITAFGFEESTIPAMSVSEEERQRIFQENWDKGNGFRFMFGTFCDITYNRDANDAACNFMKQKIKEIVRDPEKARKLLPDEPYARRPLCDGGYYDAFNHDSVDIVHLKETPITEFTENGIKTSDGKLHELDVIIFATGFDAVEGNYNRVRIKGRNGKTLQEHWAQKGPSSYLAVSVPHFPNWFMITGPQGGFTNIPPLIESQVEFIIKMIKSQMRSEPDGADVTDGGSPGGKMAIEAKEQAEDDWLALCKKLAAGTLFTETQSWIFGANIPGKPVCLRFYFGGMQGYRRCLEEESEKSYSGFKFTPPIKAA